MKQTARQGFTLIELLVVIAIVAVLATVVFAAINPLERIKQTKDAGRRSDVGQIVTALESYLTTNSQGKYPIVTGSVTGLTVLTTADLKRIPTGSPNYTYNSAADGTQATIYASLESGAITTGGLTYYCWSSVSGGFFTVANGTSLCQ